jgi:hypothetical protein
MKTSGQRVQQALFLRSMAEAFAHRKIGSARVVVDDAPRARPQFVAESRARA